LNKNIFTVPIGYVGSPVMLSIPEVYATLDKNTATVPVGYIGKEQKLIVPVSNITNDGETVTVPVGYVEREQSFRINGSKVDLSFVTADAGDILAGKVGADKNGNPVTGTIQTVKATLTDNVVTVPKGYIATAQTLIVPEMAEPSVSGNVVTIPVGYNKTQKTKTIPEAGETTVSGNVVTTPAGYVKAERKTPVGTLRESTTITPGTSWKNIPAGTYLAGDQYIAGDENLIPENIADGVSIFNVQGTHKGGMDELEFFDWMTILN
jgi:hypothetical protein